MISFKIHQLIWIILLNFSSFLGKIWRPNNYYFVMSSWRRRFFFFMFAFRIVDFVFPANFTLMRSLFMDFFYKFLTQFGCWTDVFHFCIANMYLFYLYICSFMIFFILRPFSDKTILYLVISFCILFDLPLILIEINSVVTLFQFVDVILASTNKFCLYFDRKYYIKMLICLLWLIVFCTFISMLEDKQCSLFCHSEYTYISLLVNQLENIQRRVVHVKSMDWLNLGQLLLSFVLDLYLLKNLILGGQEIEVVLIWT